MDPRPSQNPHRLTHPRLQKVLAAAGFGSRRQCETLILEGRVDVDRQVVTVLGSRVDPRHQKIRVDGIVVKSPRPKCFMLHKPVGVVSTARDPWARTRVIDLVEDPDRLFTVGRLDKSSSGLILLTNDGDLAQRLTHPSYGVEKVYRVVVAGKPTVEAMRPLRQGIHLAEGKACVKRVTLKKAHATQSVLEIVLTEGRNREIRRLLAHIGHKVQQLKRVAIGPLRLGELPVGAYRELSGRELEELRRLADRGGNGGKRHRHTRKKSTPHWPVKRR
jgi:23S rRNA pseudouridine2605 synthase